MSFNINFSLAIINHYQNNTIKKQTNNTTNNIFNLFGIFKKNNIIQPHDIENLKKLLPKKLDCESITVIKENDNINIIINKKDSIKFQEYCKTANIKINDNYTKNNNISHLTINAGYDNIKISSENAKSLLERLTLEDIPHLTFN